MDYIINSIKPAVSSHKNEFGSAVEYLKTKNLREPLNMFQMSFSKILASSLMLSNGEIVRSPRSFPTREIEQDRRYFQLKFMMEYYNSEFDDMKYWTYGCNCHVLGDRPMSDPGFGPPVDRLDSVCKQYKDCNKCAREKFGDTCIGEIVQYRYGPNVSSRSSKNTYLIQ